MKVVLKLTKKKPIEGISLEDFKVYNKYLYTDTGRVKDWNIAMYIAFRKGEKPPQKLAIEINLIKEGGEK